MRHGKHFLVIFLICCGAIFPAIAETPRPNPAQAFKGQQCVEPTDVILRQHMNFLEHQRDLTVRGGIRGAKHSLRDCVDCHAVPDDQRGGKRTVRTFCNACHEYVAVKITCFECHTDEAGEDVQTLSQRSPNHGTP